MNRNKLKAYAPQARRDFIKAVTDRAAYYGLTEDKIEPITEEGDVAIIAGKAFPRGVATKRNRLEERIKRQGFEQVMEATAYTWFNRLVAIRFMEIHGYLDHGYRVLSHPEGSTTPEIVEHAEHVYLPELDHERVIELKLEGTKEAELYRMLLIAQCNALHKAMPFLFEWVDDETELLLPENLLHSDSLIRKLVNEIPEEDWQEVEIIGWLYQFYISEKKDQVIGKVVKSEDIPAATQLFTPNWIVKYMVQNTLGRRWMATYPNSSLKQQMEFYIEPAEQTPEVQEQIKAITPESLCPEELTLLDPACGSGHILVEAYDLLKAIYQERGYRKKDIPRLILEKNLYGLEIDDRAAQLAGFALIMKAREDDRRIFENRTQPHVLAIQESKGLDAGEITEALNAPILKTELPPTEFLFEEMEDARAPLFSRKSLSVKGNIRQTDVAELIDLFEHGKTFGSLIQVPQALAEKLPAIAERVQDVLIHGGMFAQPAARSLTPIISQTRILTKKYDAAMTNPPYLARKYLPPKLNSLCEQEFSVSRANLFSVFIRRCELFLKLYGIYALITLHNWMFLSDFTDFRKRFLRHRDFLCLLHLGPNAFPEISGEIVQTAAFSARLTSTSNYTTRSFRLVKGDSDKKRLDYLDRKNEYVKDFKTHFSHVEGMPVLYWFSERSLQAFSAGTSLYGIAKPRAGLSTGDNEAFQRFWHEVAISSVGLGYNDTDQTKGSIHRWFPCNSGGDTIRWYGNHLVVVDWENDGERIKSFKDESGKLRSRPQNTRFYFKEGVTWNKLGSYGFSGRFKPRGFVFDDTSRSTFPKNRNASLKILAVLNSVVGKELLVSLNPSMSFTNWDLGRIPVLESQITIENAKRLVDIAKLSWDASEVSLDFRESPMVMEEVKMPTIEETGATWGNVCSDRIQTTRNLEAENNRILIEAYSLQEEFSSEVLEDKITLYRSDREEDIKRLISYAIGCMTGRYSLDKPGLIYAHSGNEGFDPSQYKTFPADGDGIIPTTDTDWFEDDAANRVVEFIGVAWPKEHFEDNLKFVAESLGSKRGESSRDTIRRYLVTGFYKHHLSIYKKRPICWLFSSGKERAFQCLVYLHRYNEGTLSRIRTEYVIPLQGKISARIEQLAGDIAAATSSAHRKKLEKERDRLIKQQAELLAFDEKLRHYADQRISLDLDDGVKVNYGKFGDLLTEVKAVTGKGPN